MSPEHKYYEREDGLAHCMICGGAEGSLPKECPGVKMTERELDAVYEGSLNFINGEWKGIKP